MALTIRRMGHILEHRHGNIAAQLGRGTGGHHYTHEQYPVFQGAQDYDPWSTGQDPWGGTGNYPPPTASAVPQGPAAYGSQQAYPQQASSSSGAAPAYYQFDGDNSDTDTETASTEGEPDYQDPTLHGLTREQLDEALFWAYQAAKSNWRKHTGKPTRKVRRFIHRKGKGKGKGSRFYRAKGKREESLLFPRGTHALERLLWRQRRQGQRQESRKRNGTQEESYRTRRRTHALQRLPQRRTPTGRMSPGTRPDRRPRLPATRDTSKSRTCS